MGFRQNVTSIFFFKPQYVVASQAGMFSIVFRICFVKERTFAFFNRIPRTWSCTVQRCSSTFSSVVAKELIWSVSNTGIVWRL